MALRALFGRSRELAALEAALDQAIAGHGSVFLLAGEAGIGKTRLAEELTIVAQRRGAAVFWGRAWEAPGAPACWPWIHVLGACVQTETGARFLGNPLAADLAPLLPHARSASSSAGSTGMANRAEVEALRLGSALVSLLECMSREKPLVLVFDDLHASDLASMTLLHVVARQLRSLRVLVIGTYRELEARRAPAISALLAKLAREGTTRPLGRLDKGAVTEWVTDALGNPPTPTLASAVFASTEGNPLFVDALSQLLASRGQQSFLPSGFALPDSIRETVQEMLVRVSQDVRDVLDAASVLGRECSVTALSLVCEKPVAHVHEAVNEGIAAGVLSAQPLASSPVRFAHVLIREALYQALSATRRVALHATAARSLARLFATDLDAHLAELAHHTFESATIGSWQDAADFASRAGRRAMDLFAFDDAARHFDRALTALAALEMPRETDDPGKTADDEVRKAELLWRLGVCQIRAGQTRAGAEVCERAAALALRAGRADVYAQAVLARGSEGQYGRMDARALELLESALAMGIPEDAVRARVLTRLVAAMMPLALHEKTRKLACEAIEAARASGDRTVLAEALSIVRIAFTSAEDLDRRIALGRELAVLAAGLGDKPLAIQAHVRLAIDALERGDSETVRTEIRIQQQLVDETRIPQHQLRASWIRLLWATLGGSDDEVARAEREASELAEQLDDLPGRLALATHRYVRAELRDDVAGQVAALADAEALQASDTSFSMLMPLWRADVLVAQGRRDEARAHMLEFYPDGPHMRWGPSILARAVPAYIGLGEPSWMERAYALLLPFAGTFTVLPGSIVSVGPVAHHLGSLADARGDHETAAAHFREAISSSKRAGFSIFEARARRALAALGEREVRSSPVSSDPTLHSRFHERALGRLGTIIQRYRIERLLGIGGMAAVYAASDREGQRVAIKFLLERFRHDPAFLRLFRREASVANQVGHAGAVPVLAHDVDDDGCAFLIMPLLEGETLRARWERANKRLPAPDVMALMAEVLDVLSSAHAKGIVHRDIKPENLFLTNAGEVRVLDFGIARCVDNDGSVTMTGNMIGTPAFMPPEQALGNRAAVGPHSDCWAVGATIFTLLSGELVHPAETAQAQLAAAATRPARSLHDVVPELDETIVRFVDKALAFDATHRFRSAREMREALPLSHVIGNLATELRRPTG